MSARTLVMGATGEVGRQVLCRLRGLGEPAVGASREPGKAAERMDGEWVELDLERPSTFGPALGGVARLFLVSRPGDDNPDVVAGPLLEVARAAGVTRVVNLSAMGADADPAFGLRRLELMLEACGLEFTHLRANFFMQVFARPPLLSGIQATGELRLPTGPARLSYVDARDIADVAVAALLSHRHRDRAWTLTGPEALDHDEVAGHLATASGSEIRYRSLTDHEAASQMAAAGLGPARIGRLLGFYSHVRSGLCAPVHTSVEAVLGRPARTFASFATDYARYWRVSGSPSQTSIG